MKRQYILRMLAILVLLIVPGSMRAQGVIQRLDSFESQRDSWKDLRESYQNRLNEVSKDMQTTRANADEIGKQKAVQDAKQDALENLPKSAKDAWEADVTGKDTGGVIQDIMDRNAALNRMIDAGDASNTSTEQRFDNEQKIRELEREALSLQGKIQATNTVITTLSNEMTKLTQGRVIPSVFMGWLRQFEGAIDRANSTVPFVCSSGVQNSRCDFVVWDDKYSQLPTLNFTLPKGGSKSIPGTYLGSKYCVVVLPNPAAPPMRYPDCWDHPNRYIYNRTVGTGPNN